MEMEWRWIYHIIELDVTNRFYWILFKYLGLTSAGSNDWEDYWRLSDKVGK